MADFGFERRCRLLGRREAGAAPAARRQEARQIREARRHQLRDAHRRKARRMGSARPSASKASATAVVSKLDRRDHLAVLHQHRRIVAGAVEVDLDSATAPSKRSQGRSGNRREASETTAGPAPAAPARSRTGRSRRGAGQRLRPRRPGRAPAATPPRAGRAGDRFARKPSKQRPPRHHRVEDEVRVSERQRGEADRVRVAFRSAMASFGPSPGLACRRQRGRGTVGAAAFGLAVADERQEELRQGREIGLAEASGAQDERMHAGVQHVAQGRCEAGGNPGGAAGEAGEPDEQHGPDLVARERLADADGPGRDGALLEARHLVGRQPRIDGGAEAGGQAVDRTSPCACRSTIARAASSRACTSEPRTTLAPRATATTSPMTIRPPTATAGSPSLVPGGSAEPAARQLPSKPRPPARRRRRQGDSLRLQERRRDLAGLLLFDLDLTVQLLHRDVVDHRADALAMASTLFGLGDHRRDG